jgi:ABC-type Fe3+ transport system permease subunit
LAVPEIFNTIEKTGLSTWLRETPSIFGYYFILLFHAIGMAFVVGANAVVDLRLLGVASALPIKPLKKLFPIMWAGFWMNLVSGIFLVIAYPTKEFTNIDFYCKLTFVTLGMITLSRLDSRVFENASLTEEAMVEKGKTLARWSLLFWVLSVTAGRMLSETAIYQTYGHSWGG